MSCFTRILTRRSFSTSPGNSSFSPPLMALIHRLLLVIPPIILIKDKVADVQIVSGNSMAPTLYPGDWILVNRIWRSESTPVGSVIVFANPISDRHQRLVKRVTETRKSGDNCMRYFAEGDNSESSVDSRVFGEVPEGLIEGRVLAVVWPPWHFRLL